MNATAGKRQTRIDTPPVARLGNLDDARAYFGRRDLAAAWNAALEAIRLRPFHPEAILLLAEIALAAGDSATARQCAQSAGELARRWSAPKQFLKKPLKGPSRPDWLKTPDSFVEPSRGIGTLSPHEGRVGREPERGVPQTTPRLLSPALSSLLRQEEKEKIAVGSPVRVRGDSPRLTVCVIAKNEEQFLDQCLKSIKEVASQIIVVDTGSTDRTVEIAKVHGAEVHHFAWCDDFSAARNAALEQAAGDWILMLDADEELPADQRDALRRDIAQAGAMAYRLPLINQGREAEGQSYVPRLFRNVPGVFYCGRIHEQVFPSLLSMCKSWGLEIRLGSARLLHHGYAPDVVQSRQKIERNLRLLHQAVDEWPDDVNLTMNLGLELVRSGDLPGGIAKYRDSFRLLSAQPPADVVPELREVLLTQITCHLCKVREYDEIVRVLNSPLARNGGLTASLHFALGLACFELKQYRDAVEHMRQCIGKRNKPWLSPINTDILTSAPYHCLALSLARLGDHAGAEKAFLAALHENGRIEDVKLDYARWLAERQRPVDALHALHEIITENSKHAAAWQFGGELALGRPEFLEFARDWTGEAIRYLADDPAIIAQRAEALLLSEDTENAAALWKRVCNGTRPPRAFAALIVCAAAESESVSTAINAAEEPAVSRAFLEWYQRLIAIGAQKTVSKLNSRLDVLKESLPTAARMIESAMSEAAREPA